jgi:hypothetical protein
MIDAILTFVSLATFYYAIFAVIYTAASWTIHSFFAAKVMILYEINNTDFFIVRWHSERAKK